MYKGLRDKLGLKEDVNTKRLADVIGLDSLLKELNFLKNKDTIFVFKFAN